ncbi:sugar phosphorylase [Alicyclobacillus fastidiosus]|uniref:Sucrose phosphorylase n=1 Tax=Alicyclobacillus fastidiosus TaxID=392011 RepID=A0ABV5AJC7_9BACL|nr:sugar phosphorylase [Alicyclobacillus fastidiosus]WEH09115.1 sugar phosphorylase [Alicyclobacillus fastidiosus]
MTRDRLLKIIEENLQFIYGSEYQDSYFEHLIQLIDRWEHREWAQTKPVSEENVYLITYGDSIYQEGKPTLETLHTFLKQSVGDLITDVHLLPMFPSTSDDGFSVSDYRKVDPTLGDWDTIREFAKDYRLMFDFVANHVSKSSAWFTGYLNDHETYRNYFIPFDEAFDTTKVVRPRTSPLFHEYEGKGGPKTAWTTFSEDQVDLNYRSFAVLEEMTDILLSYAYQGASNIRLDAIGFLWKESATACIHLPQTHAVIQLWRALIEYFKPNSKLITETNVPHKENTSYFGNGENEAHMVYQFPLPPLVLFTLTTHNSTKLTHWASSVETPGDQATYFNFLASHDGIGMRPTEGILTEEEKQLLVDKVVENGGRVSYKTNADGSKSVYELNINYADALVNQGEDLTTEQQVSKMTAAHAILLSFIGVPAVYYHSLLGSRNDYQGLRESGVNRRINREKLLFSTITDELKTDDYRESTFSSLTQLISIRRKESAFSPYASQTVLDFGETVFALKRENHQTQESIYFILNVGRRETTVTSPVTGINLMTDEEVNGTLYLAPYEFAWIKP